MARWKVVEDGEELVGVPKPGDLVADKYRVERVLGVGGMGCVVAAKHEALAQRVAIKFLLDKAARNPKNIERFKREAQAAALIKSDHVAKVQDIGALPDGTPYMVMELLDGEDLSDRLQRGPLPIEEAVRHILQAMEALAEAHAAGIVHRDLKPANLFLSRLPTGDVRLKVLDFGISKVHAGKGHDLTRTSNIMGSPLYMSPEQMLSAKSADNRTDIWALGIILFELIGGRPPFIGETLPEICSKILTAPPTPLTELLPGVPPALTLAIDMALAKKPEDRYPSLTQFAMALAPFAGPDGARSVAIVTRILAGAPLPGPATIPDGTPAFATSGQITGPPQPPTVSAPPAQITGDTRLVGPTLASSDAVAMGAVTGAPVASTRNEEGRRSRTGLIAVGAVLLVCAGGAFAVFAATKGGKGHGGPAASAEARQEEAPEKAEPTTTTADPEPAAEPVASAAPSALPATSALTPRQQRKQARDNKTPAPRGYRPKPGDDMFE